MDRQSNTERRHRVSGWYQGSRSSCCSFKWCLSWCPKEELNTGHSWAYLLLCAWFLVFFFFLFRASLDIGTSIPPFLPLPVTPAGQGGWLLAETTNLCVMFTFQESKSWERRKSGICTPSLPQIVSCVSERSRKALLFCSKIILPQLQQFGSGNALEASGRLSMCRNENFLQILAWWRSGFSFWCVAPFPAGLPILKLILQAITAQADNCWEVLPLASLAPEKLPFKLLPLLGERELGMNFWKYFSEI